MSRIIKTTREETEIKSKKSDEDYGTEVLGTGLVGGGMGAIVGGLLGGPLGALAGGVLGAVGGAASVDEEE